VLLTTVPVALVNEREEERVDWTDVDTAERPS